MCCDGASLHVSVPTAAFEPNCLAIVLDLPPFFEHAIRPLTMYYPQLSCLRRCYRSIVFCPGRIPSGVYYETGPQAWHDYPQVGHEYVGHVFTMCIFVVHEYNMSTNGHINK